MSENVEPWSQSTRPADSGDRRASAIPLPQGGEIHNNYQHIQDFIKKLERIYDDVEDITSPVLDPLEYTNLSINCQELKLNSNGSYANPHPQPYFFNASFPNVANHHIDLEKEGGNYRVDYDAFGKVLKRYMHDPLSAYPSATQLCDELDWEFCEYPRKGIKDNLAAHSNWRQSGNFQEDAIFHRVFWDELLLPDKTPYTPVSAYVSPSGKHPHIMFSMRHDIKEEEKLLRGEILAIVAAIITRLERFSSAEHLYIPVLVFSFMGHLHGRILQAYYDGTAVVIRKTKLYHFLPENARDLLNLFMQQMANTPIGATKGVPPVDTKKMPQGFSQGLSLQPKPSNIQ